ncbi:MAG: hypothetical protein ABJA70_23470 [Chryseolinea sp.]
MWTRNRDLLHRFFLIWDDGVYLFATIVAVPFDDQLKPYKIDSLLGKQAMVAA